MKKLIFVGPPIIALLAGDPPPKVRTFLIIAHDESCHVQLEIDEPWMSDDAIGERLSGREGTDRLVSSIAKHLLSGGEVGRQTTH